MKVLTKLGLLALGALVGIIGCLIGSDLADDYDQDVIILEDD